MKYENVPYLTLDGEGREYERPARVIHELPTPAERLEACRAAAAKIAGLIKMPAPDRIHFGTPVYTAFGMRPVDAKRHSQADLLLTHGCDLPLVYCE